MLNAIAGSDPADPATPRPIGARSITRRARPDALTGKRIGVMRFAAGFGTDEAFERALPPCARKAPTLVEIRRSRRRSGRNEIPVLLTEFKADLNAYLATRPAAACPSAPWPT